MFMRLYPFPLLSLFVVPRTRAQVLARRDPMTVLRRWMIRVKWRLWGFGHEPMKWSGWDRSQLGAELVRSAATGGAEMARRIPCVVSVSSKARDGAGRRLAGAGANVGASSLRLPARAPPIQYAPLDTVRTLAVSSLDTHAVCPSALTASQAPGGWVVKEDVLFSEAVNRYYTQPLATYDDGGVGRVVLSMKNALPQEEERRATPKVGGEGKKEQRRRHRPINGLRNCFLIATKP